MFCGLWSNALWPLVLVQSGPIVLISPIRAKHDSMGKVFVETTGEGFSAVYAPTSSGKAPQMGRVNHLAGFHWAR